jgi:hypothetical protein
MARIDFDRIRKTQLFLDYAGKPIPKQDQPAKAFSSHKL